MATKVAVLLVAVLATCVAGRTVVVAGDSWADYRGIPNRVFPEVFQTHGDPRSITNIAVSGSTCADWAGRYLPRLEQAVRERDVETVWMTCGGNDARAGLTGCRPMSECIAKVVEQVHRDLHIISAAVHRANPNARIVAFGYDLMGFSGLVCGLVPPVLLPECSRDPFCVNSNFLQLQAVVNEMAQELPYFDSVNLLGSLQTLRGVEGASIGVPVLDQYSPQNTFDGTCIHPTEEGYRTIFTNLYNRYFKQSALNSTVPHRTP